MFLFILLFGIKIHLICLCSKKSVLVTCVVVRRNELHSDFTKHIEKTIGCSAKLYPTLLGLHLANDFELHMR